MKRYWIVRPGEDRLTEVSAEEFKAHLEKLNIRT